jgi:outer membrane protein assembly factor BamE (lipoprotein component of BamABCDE complex)
MSTNKIALTIFCISILCSCSSSKQNEWFVTHNGNMPSEERIAKIEKGTSKDDVVQILGMPSTVAAFDENTWIYMSSDIKRVAFLEPKEIDRKILKIKFGDNDNVINIVRLNKENGVDVTPSQEKTEVKGQEPGFFQKYFGGVGQYNPFASQPSANGL